MSKLLYITNQICGSGGLERVLSIKVSLFVEKLGYEAHIITLNQGNQSLFYNFSDKIKFHDVAVRGNIFKYFNDYRKNIKKIINQVNPDIILVCDDGIKGLFVPLIIGKICPMIYERHASKNIEVKTDKLTAIQRVIKFLKFNLMDLGGSFYDHFIVLTKGNLKEWKLKNLKVIPNPLSFYPQEQSSLSNKIVLAVGKQCYYKGYDRLLKAWKMVNEKYPEWKLKIYGKIDKEEGLEKLANNLKISNSINFYSPIKHIGEKYKEASIYVMTSRHEGFGMVLIEAMSYGVPCISFDCPYGPEGIITDGEDGVLVENGNIELFAEKVKNLIQNKELRIALGECARNNVSQYLPDHIVSQWDLIFKDLLRN